MHTTLREARTRAGVSIAELAERLRISKPSVSTLELNDARRVAKLATVDRALEALGLERWEVLLPRKTMERIMAEAQEIAAEVDWTMALEAQNLTPESIDAIVRRLVVRKIAETL